MNHENVRRILKEYFKDRTVDQLAERLYPVLPKARIDNILNGTGTFEKAEVLILAAADNEVVNNSANVPQSVIVPQKVRDLIDKLRPEVGSIKGVGRH